MKIIFWGTPDYSLKTLNVLIEKGHTVLGVVTQPDRKRGRGNTELPSPIKIRAQELGIKVFTPQNIREDTDVQNQIFSLKADIFIVVAFGQILPTTILEHPPYGCWNSHASILPRWRGAAPIQRSLIKGDKVTGVGIMYMEAGLDTGPILLEEKTKIDISDNYNTLSARLSSISADLMIESLILIEKVGKCSTIERLHKLKVCSQSSRNTKATYAKMLTKGENKIDWELDGIQIHRQISGVYPNAYTKWKNKRIKIIETIPLEVNINYNLEDRIEYGSIIDFSSEYGLKVRCKNHDLIIIKAQLEGKRVESKNVLIQQLNPKIGDKFN